MSGLEIGSTYSGMLLRFWLMVKVAMRCVSMAVWRLVLLISAESVNPLKNEFGIPEESLEET